jgi:putative ABC transport system permease protein
MASMAGVYGTAKVAREALQGDSRAWLAGDIGVDLREPIDQEQAGALNRLRTHAVQWTVVTTALTMAASDQSADAAFIDVKVVDPSLYPFYGAVTLAPNKLLSEILTPDRAAVSQEVLDRLSVRLGDMFLIAGQPFRIAAVIKGEPDRFSGSVGLGMRCILSREGYGRTRLEESGVSVSHRVLLRLDPGFGLAKGRRLLEGLFPGGAIREYRTAYGRQMDAALTFLGITSFLTLILGAMGVGISIRQHADESMVKLAIMKILGGGSAQISAVFIIEAATLILAAVLLAAPLAVGVEVSLLAIVRKYLVLPRDVGWSAGAMVQSTAASVVAISAAVIGPMVVLRRLRPAEMLRQTDVSAAQPNKNDVQFTRLAVGFACVALVFFAHGLVRGWSDAFLLAGAVAASLALSWAVTSMALGVAKKWMPRGLKLMPSWLRLGIAGLYRPGNHSRLLVTALSVAFLMMIATFEAVAEVISAVFDVLPDQADSLYIGRFRDAQKDGLRAFLMRQPGVRAVHLITQTRLRMRGVNPDDTRAFSFNYLVACEPPQFFTRPPTQQLPRSVIAADSARKLGIHVGSQIQFESRNGIIQSEVVEVRKLTPAEKVWSTLHLDCSGVEDASLFHQAAVEISPESIPAVRRALMAEYPTFAIITNADIVETVQSVSRDVVMLVRIVAWLATGAGICILLAIIAASRGARLREIGILMALGARRSLLIKIYSVEFAALGLLAGVIAAILNASFTTLVLSITFDELHMAHEWRPAAAAIGISAVLTCAAGWLPTWALLRKKPWNVLRDLGVA